MFWPVTDVFQLKMHWGEVQFVVWCGLMRTFIFIVVSQVRAVHKFDLRCIVN